MRGREWWEPEWGWDAEVARSKAGGEPVGRRGMPGFDGRVVVGTIDSDFERRGSCPGEIIGETAGRLISAKRTCELGIGEIPSLCGGGFSSFDAKVSHSLVARLRERLFRDSRRRRWSEVIAVRSQLVSGTQRNVSTNMTATMIPTMMKTHRQPMDWITAADTNGTRFFPPRRSIVYIPSRNARS
jgi:hypothetical protein